MTFRWPEVACRLGLYLDASVGLAQWCRNMESIYTSLYPSIYLETEIYAVHARIQKVFFQIGSNIFYGFFFFFYLIRGEMIQIPL